VPKSKVRKKPSYSGVAAASLPTSGSGHGKGSKPSAPWYPVVMSALLVLGLAYLVVYYMAGDSLGFMVSLGNWNFAVGFALLIAGLGMAVGWR